MEKDTGAMQSASLVQGLSEKPLLMCFGTHRRSALQRNRALQPLCHEHHLEMRHTQVPLQTGSGPSQTLVYACSEPDCLVHYNSSGGYFTVLHNGNGIDRDMMPELVCSQDGLPMYLAEVLTTQRSCLLSNIGERLVRGGHWLPPEVLAAPAA